MSALFDHEFSGGLGLHSHWSNGPFSAGLGLSNPDLMRVLFPRQSSSVVTNEGVAQTPDMHSNVFGEFWLFV